MPRALIIAAAICNATVTDDDASVNSIRSAVLLQRTNPVPIRSVFGSAASRGTNFSQSLSIGQIFTSIPDQLDGISVNIRYSSVREEILSFPARKPRTFNVLLATTKTWLADLVVQLASSWQAKRDGKAGANGSVWRLDWRRSAAFAVFGCVYVGIAQWFFLVSLFSVLCPRAIRFANEPLADKLMDTAGQMDLVRQVCYDNFLLEAFIYFPVFYMIKESLTANTTTSGGAADLPAGAAESPAAGTAGAAGDGAGAGGRGGDDGEGGASSAACSCAGRRPAPAQEDRLATRVARAAQEGLRRYRSNFWVDNLTSCAVWIPGDILVYAAPMYLRMPLDHCLSFAWTMLLSFSRGGGAK